MIGTLLPYRFLVADDHPLYLDAIRTQLVRDYPDSHFHGTNNFAGVLDLLENPSTGEQYSLLMIDYSMPGLKSAKAVSRLVGSAKSAPVVLMSGVALSEEIAKCAAVGVVGFLPKTLDEELFSITVRMLLRGGTYYPAEYVTEGRFRDQLPAIDDAGRESLQSDSDPQMSETTKAIISAVRAGKGNKEIARQLDRTEATVKWHLSRLYVQFGAKNRTHLMTLLSD